MEPGRPLRVLYVCTGNVCRSPAAELLLRSVTDGDRLTVSSAGTGALVGESVDPPTAQALRERGVDPSTHRAQQFEAGLAWHADLVLTATVEQRDAVMREIPRAFRRVFTMREFARLASPDDGGDARTVIAARAERRGTSGPVDPDADDIVDAFGASLATAREVVSAVAATLDAVVHLVDDVPPTRPLPRPARPSPTARSRPAPAPRPRPVASPLPQERPERRPVTRPRPYRGTA